LNYTQKSDVPQSSKTFEHKISYPRIFSDQKGRGVVKISLSQWTKTHTVLVVT